MPDEPSNWTQACDALHPICPFCSNDSADLIERRGHEWWCAVCSRSWLALNASDRRFLKRLHVTPDG